MSKKVKNGHVHALKVSSIAVNSDWMANQIHSEQIKRKISKYNEKNYRQIAKIGVIKSIISL